ncbi:MAG TPA: hypothetical protein VIN75_05800 [Burkholderiaceae bacterium]
MLFPEHPKPVSRRRAVAEMTVAARQAAAITPGHVLVLPATAASPPAPVQSTGADDPPVSPRRHDTPI